MSTDASRTSSPNGPFTYRRCIAATAAGGLGLALIGAGLAAIFLVTFGPEEASSTTAATSQWAPEPVVAPPGWTHDSTASPASTAAPAPADASLQPIETALLVPPVAQTAAAPETAPEIDIARTVSIAHGDTLMTAMVEAGVDRSEAHAAITALATLYNPRKLQPGQELTLVFEKPETPEGQARLMDVSLNASVEREVVARRTDDGDFVASEVEKVLQSSYHRAKGSIDTSLYLAAVDNGVPVPVLTEMVHIFSYDVDFQRDVQPGDSFAVYYEGLLNESGEEVKQGDILFARLTLSGHDLAFYRFELPDGTVDYFNEKGESVRKALMKTPIDGARLSSGFGMRHHPILGYSRMHKGIDFAAPRGTPVMAAGDGVVEVAARYGSYGNYVRIRHNDRYKTAYAHLSRFGRGIKRGARVTQGQIIAYVGTTGRSTGPHLHYEVLVSGHQVNPMGLKLPAGKTLKGKQLTAFQNAREALDARIAAAPLARQVAQGN